MARLPSDFERGLLRALQAPEPSADHPAQQPPGPVGSVASHGPLTVNVYAARNRLSELLQRVETGETVIIARAGTPVAQLSSWRGQTTSLRAPGSWAGKIRHCPSFNRPFGQERP